MAVEIKIYLLGTPKFLLIKVSQNAKVQDVIRHIMTLYKKDAILSKNQAL